VEFPEERMVFGMLPEDFQKMFKDSGRFLIGFFMNLEHHGGTYIITQILEGRESR
jgi:hypothetical protein